MHPRQSVLKILYALWILFFPKKQKTYGIILDNEQEYISLTDMLKAKDGDFFISDWLRNRNTVEYLGIWESVYNPSFNYGEFATIKSQAGLNSYKLSVKEWVEKTNAIGLESG
ncbi:MAG TPA: KilA-N domain-containing protein [Hanamia sp.]|nr:KilA-N domain-containing protein [Hanamia sp.]